MAETLPWPPTQVYHVLKEHPFRKLALELRKAPAPPRILGLTASLTYAVNEPKIKKDVARICKELQVQYLPYVSEEELRQDGYTTLGTQAEVLPYQVPSGCTASSGVVPVEQRRPVNFPDPRGRRGVHGPEQGSRCVHQGHGGRRRRTGRLLFLTAAAPICCEGLGKVRA